jgi:hypothetical protein
MNPTLPLAQVASFVFATVASWMTGQSNTLGMPLKS